jgi:predicted nucleic acid-binding protein
MKTTRPYLRFGTTPKGVTLDAGESEAIAMSLECPADLLIMDESSGRAMARNLKIRITGTLGVLLKAKTIVSRSEH